MTAPAAKSSPRDAQVMSAILKDMGVTEHEPRLINQMLEFTYRYVTDVLDDAKVYSNHGNKKVIDTEDVQLGVQCRMDHSFTTPPPRDLLLEIGRHKNSQSLPLIKPYTGPRLPPDRYCLSAPNYKLASNKKKMHRIQIGLPVNPLSGGHRIQLTPVQKQQKVQIGSQGQMTVINRPSQVKPLVRVQQGPGLLSAGSSNLPQQFIKTQSQPMMAGQQTLMTGQQTLMTGQQTLMSGQQTLMSGQQTLMSGQQTLLTGAQQTYISGLVNPLKRKMEDDDYDQT